MGGFKFDKRALDKLGKQTTKAVSADRQPVLDRVHRSHAGRPVPEVKAALVRAWPGDLPDATATEWATLISEGRRVILRPS